MDVKEFIFYYNEINKDKRNHIDDFEVVLKNSAGYCFDFCSNNCEYLNLNEREQNLYKTKEDHVCKKYNKTLKHENFHPLILKCEECLNEKA